MTPEERSSLSVDSPEYGLRFVCNTIVFTRRQHSNPTSQDTRLKDPACWMDGIRHHALGPQGIITSVLHTFDGMLGYLLHFRTISDIILQAGMGRFYELRIYIGYGLVSVSYLVVVMNLFLGCRPFHRNWQINPDPGGMNHQSGHHTQLLTVNSQMSASLPCLDKWSGSTSLSMSSRTCTFYRSRFLCFGSQASGRRRSSD